jgi:hypothetical protein
MAGTMIVTYIDKHISKHNLIQTFLAMNCLVAFGVAKH